MLTAAITTITINTMANTMRIGACQGRFLIFLLEDVDSVEEQHVGCAVDSEEVSVEEWIVMYGTETDGYGVAEPYEDVVRAESTVAEGFVFGAEVAVESLNVENAECNMGSVGVVTASAVFLCAVDL